MPHQPLPLKYRPQILAELVGQGWIRATLENALRQEAIAPAYLFCGPRGAGKTSTARILAKSLNCANSSTPTVTPCNQCSECRAIDRGSSLDVSEIDAASHNGVDDARLLVETSSFAPARSRYRIFILDEIQCLTGQAQNALLKCLEEPPSRTIFILCTTAAHKVLPTVASRCQIFPFRAHPIATVIARLHSVAQAEGIVVEPEALSAIARAAQGSLRDALQLLSQLQLLDGTVTVERVAQVSGSIRASQLRSLVAHLAQGNCLATLKEVQTLVDSGKDPKFVLDSLLQVYRDLLLVKTAPDAKELISSAISYQKLRSLGRLMDREQIGEGLNRLYETRSQLDHSSNAATWLEVCLLRLSQSSSSGLDSVWAEAVSLAKPNSQKLLDQANLIALNSKRAVLAADPKSVRRLLRHRSSLERLLSKVLGRNVTVEVKESA